MYVPPRPCREDDPWFAVRLGLAVVTGFVAMATLNPTVAVVCVVLPLGLIAGQRKAFNPGRAMAGPVMLGVMVWIMAASVALLRPNPMLLTLVMGLLFFAAFYVTRHTGSGVGMLILVSGVLMSIAGMKAPELLNVLRDGFVLGCLVALVSIPLLFILVPPQRASGTRTHPGPRRGIMGRGRRSEPRCSLAFASGSTPSCPSRTSTWPCRRCSR